MLASTCVRAALATDLPTGKNPVPFSRLVDVAAAAGLTATMFYGEATHATYVTEIMGGGCAFFDYDNDGWMDIFILGGRRLESVPLGASNRLYKNNRDGTFTDVTAKSGLSDAGWATGVCVGDYNNDGHEDLFVTYYGQNRLYRNNGDGTFTDVTEKAGLLQPHLRFGSGCTFVDYNREAAKLQPDSAHLAYMIGLSLYNGGEVDKAVLPLQQSVRLDPTVVQSHLALAAALDHIQRIPEAEAEWRAALALDSRSAPALDGLARDLLGEKNFAAVIALLSAAPPTPERSVNLALAYTRTGRLDDASRVLRAAHDADPTSLPVSTALAGALIMQSRKQEAEDILKASIKEHPTDLGLKTLYLRMLVMNDDTDNAKQLGTELLAAAPQNWEVLYLNGVLERRAGDYQQARDHLEQAAQLNPQNVECRQDLGSVLARLKDAPGARVQLEKAIALGSEDPEVRFELAGVLRTLGLNDDADKQLKLYQQEAQKKSDLTQAGAKAAFGDEKLAAGEPLEAAKLYREALTYAPKESSLAYKLAMALDKAGDLQANTPHSSRRSQSIQLCPKPLTSWAIWLRGPETPPRLRTVSGRPCVPLRDIQRHGSILPRSSCLNPGYRRHGRLSATHSNWSPATPRHKSSSAS